MELLYVLCFLVTFGISSSFKQLPLADVPTAADDEVVLLPTTRDSLLDLHRNLVEIESITGNESHVGKWLASYLKQHGLTVELQEVESGRYNVFAYSGKKRETDILVTSHIDTVPPYLPYELKMNDSEIWGRGSSDAKASVATQVIALMDLLHSHKDRVSEGSVSLLFVVGEELDGSGMRFFSDHKPTNYSSVIFGEPTERKLASGHKGIIQFLIKVKGRPAHSGYPWLGLSANEVLVQALAKLLELEAKLPGSEMLGKSTLNIGRIEGGVAANVVAQDALARVAIRLAGGTPEEIEDMIFDALRELREKTEYNGGLLDIEIIGRPYGPIMLDADVDGFKKISVNYGTDIPNLDGDHKKYLYGPGSILVAHSDHENIRVADLEGAVKDYQRLILATLGRA